MIDLTTRLRSLMGLKEMTFRVGQKVVCVDASGVISAKPLSVGPVYTIRELFDDPTYGHGVILEEIINGISLRGEFGYRSSRFRPVVDRKTDISIFTKMLPRQAVTSDPAGSSS